MIRLQTEIIKNIFFEEGNCVDKFENVGIDKISSFNELKFVNLTSLRSIII